MIVRPSIAFSDFSGSAKGVTARSTKGRTILSSKSQYSSRTTPAQVVSRNTLSKISRSYKQLSDSQMKGWETLAGRMKGIYAFDKLVELIPLSIKMLQIWNIHLNMSTNKHNTIFNHFNTISLL